MSRSPEKAAEPATFGAYVRTKRKGAHLSLEEVAHKAQLSHQYLSQVERDVGPAMRREHWSALVAAIPPSRSPSSSAAAISRPLEIDLAKASPTATSSLALALAQRIRDRDLGEPDERRPPRPAQSAGAPRKVRAHGRVVDAAGNPLAGGRAFAYRVGPARGWSALIGARAHAGRIAVGPLDGRAAVLVGTASTCSAARTRAAPASSTFPGASARRLRPRRPPHGRRRRPRELGVAAHRDRRRRRAGRAVCAASGRQSSAARGRGRRRNRRHGRYRPASPLAVRTLPPVAAARQAVHEPAPSPPLLVLRPRRGAARPHPPRPRPHPRRRLRQRAGVGRLGAASAASRIVDRKGPSSPRRPRSSSSPSSTPRRSASRSTSPSRPPTTTPSRRARRATTSPTTRTRCGRAGAVGAAPSPARSSTSTTKPRSAAPAATARPTPATPARLASPTSWVWRGRCRARAWSVPRARSRSTGCRRTT
jgi:transcriptional regulator with XRE-family HTH domain